MKKIDAHSHIGDFGGWAKVAIDIDKLILSCKIYAKAIYELSK